MPKVKKKRGAAKSPEATVDEAPHPDTLESADIDPCIERCKALKQQLKLVEFSNDVLTLRIERSKREIERLRLERALLHEYLAKSLRAKATASRHTKASPPTPNTNDPQVTSSQDNDAQPDPPALASADENSTNISK
ncbi:non-histone protein [Rhizina undulata]